MIPPMRKRRRGCPPQRRTFPRCSSPSAKPCARLFAPGSPLATKKIAYHPPCTLQHGQKLTGGVEMLLTDAGFELAAVAEKHLCCGSAGTYSILQPEIAGALKTRKLGHLQAGAPEMIVTANIGCLTHLQSGTSIPVRHWVELLDDALAAH